ncbi:unnamed protein product [Didymodactylos carnosus]|uniref:Uncharacterized protein n=1 Tax=Didymodactylos carnosus TaxID=1234261 RepID=A0A813W8Q3_9BILA|nr:unnamed protein product [Didymodactylos carnosus]CAF3637441.1 unnamed protein product [Didymodactylos carnosus]
MWPILMRHWPDDPIPVGIIMLFLYRKDDINLEWHYTSLPSDPNSTQKACRRYIPDNPQSVEISPHTTRTLSFILFESNADVDQSGDYRLDIMYRDQVCETDYNGAIINEIVINEERSYSISLID